MPYIFGHRGFMGKYIENTMEGFSKAILMGVGIESDVQLTKDNKLVCFHDKSFKIKGRWYDLSKLTMNEINNLKFVDGRVIPTVLFVLQTFQDKISRLRFSFDIRNDSVGFQLINLIVKHNLLAQVEITDRRLSILRNLRNYHNQVKLVYTIPEKIKSFDNKKLDFELLNDLKLNTLNIVSWRATPQDLKIIIDNGFNCYVWGVNSKTRMKKLFSFKYKEKKISAIYTDYPDIALKIKNQIVGDTLK